MLSCGQTKMKGSFYVRIYYAEMEPVGQVSAQAPQSMQVSGLIS
jgi:hypothetical protein